MRIRDWSSDVCSSDLIARADSEDVCHLFLSLATLVPNPAKICGKDILQIHPQSDRRKGTIVLGMIVHIRYVPGAELIVLWGPRRSEERRVGKECVSQCRSRWSPSH